MSTDRTIQGKTVLIVDDTSYTRVVIRRILEPEGFVIVGEARDGFEAVFLGIGAQEGAHFLIGWRTRLIPG